jgi:hypothetical protein
MSGIKRRNFKNERFAENFKDKKREISVGWEEEREIEE